MITAKKLTSIYDTITDLILEIDEELVPALNEEREAIEERASNRESGELTEREAERLDMIESLIYELSDEFKLYLEQAQSSVENAISIRGE